MGLSLGGRGGDVSTAAGQRWSADDSKESVRHLQRMAVVQRLLSVVAGTLVHGIARIAVIYPVAIALTRCRVRVPMRCSAMTPSDEIARTPALLRSLLQLDYLSIQ